MNSPAAQQRQRSLIITTHRDIFQWIARGKELSGSDYQEHSAVLRMAPVDMEALQIGDESTVMLCTNAGTVVVRVYADAGCPPGIGCMPVSPYSNLLISYDPEQTGLSAFKRIEVKIEATTEEITPLADLLSVPRGVVDA